MNAPSILIHALEAASPILIPAGWLLGAASLGLVMFSGAGMVRLAIVTAFRGVRS